MTRLLLLLLLALLTSVAARAATEEETLPLPSGVAITSQRHAAAGDSVVLWLSGQYGRLEEEQRAASYLAGQGMEVWLTDWLAPYFLPQVASSIEAVPDADLVDWLEAMRQRHAGKRLLLLASGHATALPLRAVAGWRERHGDAAAPPAVGALLLWPLLYQDPDPGEEPEYAPVVGKTRLPLVILVPQSSAGYWWRERLLATFEAAGSQVRLEVLPGLRDRFHHRGDATAREQVEAARLGEILAPHLRTLAKETRP